MFWFKKQPKVNIEKLGVIPDPRSPEEKKKDYKAEELFSFAPFEWKERPESEWRKFLIFFQDYSSSCVAQMVIKLLGIENWIEEGKFVHYSARDIYTKRSNAGEGMYFLEGMKIGHEGVTFEQLMPSQGLNEVAMNIKDDRTPLCEIVAKPGAGGNYLQVAIDIDKIASIIELGGNGKGKGVALGVRFGSNEWAKPVPEILTNDLPYCHAITGTNAILYQGKRAIVIEDSWGIDSGIQGRRIITEDWFKAGRIIFAGYYEFLSNLGEGEKPKHQFNVNLKYGNINEEVVWLKKCLNYLKIFPDGTFTQIFEGMTLKAVQLFQETYKKEISQIVGYQISATGFVGTGTRTKLNQLFA